MADYGGHAAPEYVVIGIPVSNPTTMATVQKVVRVAVVMTVFVIIQNIVIMMLDDDAENLYNTVLNTLLALAVPACGYFGAKQGDRNLMCCFCGCSAFNAVFLVWMTVAYLSVSASGESGHSIIETVISIALLSTSAVLYTVAYYLGNKLYNDQSLYVRHGGQRQAQVPMATVAHPAQPAAGAPTAYPPTASIPVAQPVGHGGAYGNTQTAYPQHQQQSVYPQQQQQYYG